MRTTAKDRKRLGFSLFELLIVIVIIGILLALMLPAVRTARPATRRSQCRNNLKQIALALHNYAEEYGALPPAYTVDAEGKSLHSWRTLILPFLDQGPLYDSIDLLKPWDDPANAQAYDTVLDVYRCPSAETAPNSTTYLGLVGSNACFHSTEPRPFSEITDGTEYTLMVIEASPKDAIHWMSPEDDGAAFLMRFGAKTEPAHEDGTHGLFADGSARFLSVDMPKASRRAMISIAGNDDEVVEAEE